MAAGDMLGHIGQRIRAQEGVVAFIGDVYGGRHHVPAFQGHGRIYPPIAVLFAKIEVLEHILGNAVAHTSAQGSGLIRPA